MLSILSTLKRLVLAGSQPKTELQTTTPFRDLPGVSGIKNVSVEGKPAMQVEFVDGLILTINQKSTAHARFDIFWPSEKFINTYGRESTSVRMMPALTEAEVLGTLTKISSEALKKLQSSAKQDG